MPCDRVCWAYIGTKPLHTHIPIHGYIPFEQSEVNFPPTCGPRGRVGSCLILPIWAGAISWCVAWVATETTACSNSDIVCVFPISSGTLETSYSFLCGANTNIKTHKWMCMGMCSTTGQSVYVMHIHIPFWSLYRRGPRNIPPELLPPHILHMYVHVLHYLVSSRLSVENYFIY